MYSSDGVFVLVPEAGVEVNINRWFRLAATGGFTSMELLAGAYNGSSQFVAGGYSNADGSFGSAIFSDARGSHGSDFALHAVDFEILLVGLPPDTPA